MEYVDEIAPHDEVVEQNGARVMIAPMAQMFLFGTEIDYETGLIESGFSSRTPTSSRRLRLRRVDPLLRAEPRGFPPRTSASGGARSGRGTAWHAASSSPATGR